MFLNFDQGGFASFVLLCGITVNASIYILNEQEYSEFLVGERTKSPVFSYICRPEKKMNRLKIWKVSHH